MRSDADMRWRRLIWLLAAAWIGSGTAAGAETITVGVIDTLTEKENLSQIRKGLETGLDPNQWQVRTVSVLSADEVTGIERCSMPGKRNVLPDRLLSFEMIGRTC